MSTVCRLPLVAFGVENSLDAVFKCAIWGDDFDRIFEIESILDLDAGEAFVRVVFSDDSEVFLFFDFSIFFEPYSHLSWIPNEESGCVSTIGDGKQLLGTFISIITFSFFYRVKCLSIPTTDPREIVDGLTSSFYFE